MRADATRPASKNSTNMTGPTTSHAELTPHLRTPGAALSGQMSLSRASTLSQLSSPHNLVSISSSTLASSTAQGKGQPSAW
eukprot:scaffold84286_cov63-Phaeocystis_antarctica.AAC.4